jgi:phosphatidylserine/phosphatidylglycerophosphate/cardiolipin synthase-like enzyme
MAVFADGKIEAFVGPQELGAADNLETVIVKFIDEAEHRLYIAVQELDSREIAKAIIRARWRKVVVRMVLEQDYLMDEKVPRAEVHPLEGESEADAIERVQWTEPAGTPDGVYRDNRIILSALLRNNVDVRSDYNPTIFHQKFIIRDYYPEDQKTSKRNKNAALLTGSTNFTYTDTHLNLNHVIIFYDPRITADYSVEFQQIWSGTFGVMRDRHRPEPDIYLLNGVPVKVLFAPDHTPELEIMKQMMKSINRIDFAIFTFSGSSGVDDALTLAHRAGREINGVLDPGQGNQKWSATKWLLEEGIKLYYPNKRGEFAQFRKLHHKLMVIDRAIVVSGSMNYTDKANLVNDENIFVLGSPYPELKDVGKVDAERCAALADFFRAEIDRIIAHSRPVTPRNA